MSERASTRLYGRNRPDWRAPLRIVTANAKPPANPWPLNRPWPDAMRCKAIARATGQRCRNAHMQGAKLCHKHGGHSQAFAAQPAPFVSLTYLRRPRRALAELGAVFGDVSERSIIERGRALEGTLDPDPDSHTVRDTETETD